MTMSYEGPTVIDPKNTFDERFKVAINPEVINGYNSLLVEGYVERNIKAGDQWESSGFQNDSDVEDLIITTGAEFVIIKGFLIQVDGEGVQYQIFKDPEFVASPNLTTVPIYNLRKDITTNPLFTLEDIPDADIANEGTPVSPLITIIGSSNPGSSASTPTALLEGLERILPPNSTFLLKRNKLTGSANQRSTYYATFYEGELSVDLPPVG